MSAAKLTSAQVVEFRSCVIGAWKPTGPLSGPQAFHAVEAATRSKLSFAPSEMQYKAQFRAMRDAGFVKVMGHGRAAKWRLARSIVEDAHQVEGAACPEPVASAIVATIAPVDAPHLALAVDFVAAVGSYSGAERALRMAVDRLRRIKA